MIVRQPNSNVAKLAKGLSFVKHTNLCCILKNLRSKRIQNPAMLMPGGRPITTKKQPKQQQSETNTTTTTTSESLTTTTVSSLGEPEVSTTRLTNLKPTSKRNVRPPTLRRAVVAEKSN